MMEDKKQNNALGTILAVIYCLAFVVLGILVKRCVEG